MRHFIAVIALCMLGACAAGLDDDSSYPNVDSDNIAEVDVKIDPLQGPDYTYTNSNNGTDCRDQSNSYKARALCTYIKYFAGSNPSNLHNQFTCGAEDCTANITFNFNGTTVNAGDNWHVGGCFDLPSCAGWNCRECYVHFNGLNWYAHTLHYQQGYGLAKLYWGGNSPPNEFGNAYISDSQTSKFTRTAP